jgi:hypothetical protein
MNNANEKTQGKKPSWIERRAALPTNVSRCVTNDRCVLETNVLKKTNILIFMNAVLINQ